MLVMKFGGTSMGSAERMCNSAVIIRDRARSSRVGVVVSAVSGISNMLQDSIIRLFKETGTVTPAQFTRELKERHDTIIADLASSVHDFSAVRVQEQLALIYTEYEQLLSASAAFGECPDTVECRILGMGERLSVPIMAEILSAAGEDLRVLDSRDFIITDGGPVREADPAFDKIENAFMPLRASGENILLMGGFVSSDVSGKQTLLGRNGSDFSAALMAMGLDAKQLEIWSDVDGIYTADPRIVPDAELVHDISYEEAMELSFFGSKVLHPKTLTPIASRRIETWSRNSFNPSARGTRIGPADSIQYATGPGPVRGISCLSGVALVSVSGAGLKGRRGIAARVFSAVSRSGASVLLITQSSSEFTISFCVRENETETVRRILNEEFVHEMQDTLVNEVSVLSGMSIVSIVGDGMISTRGIAGKFFSALAFGGINIHAIAQGSSERSISTVVAKDEGDKAVRIAHRFFFDTMQTIELFLFGIGVVGGKLLEQVRLQQKELEKSNIALRVCGIANSRVMCLDRSSLDLSAWNDLLAASDTPSSVDGMLSFVRSEQPLNPVFVDCTATGDLPLRYAEILEAGIHVVTPNKRANSGEMGYYQSIRSAAAKNRKRFLYETNVGAGLPVIDTFRNMLKSGDRLLRFEGIMSGSLSYIFGRLDEGIPFSQAVLEAREKGFTEPDPRDDLSGMDVARKALIIAREAGMTLNLDDVLCVGALPAEFDTSGTVAEFLERLPGIDEWYKKRIAAVKAAGNVLRFVGTITDGRAAAGPVEVLQDGPLAVITGGSNAFVFTTRYYSPIPLVIHGYGAGADVTAAGVFADILRTATW